MQSGFLDFSAARVAEIAIAVRMVAVRKVRAFMVPFI